MGQGVRSRPSGRAFLFLQGMATRFFERLGQALTARGHAVHRINFNGGDRAFWRLPQAIDFSGRAEDWPEFLDQLIVDRAISDVILFGDCRPLHRAAIRVAEQRSLRIHVVEEGYLRPDWITFEEGGVNGNSALPRDPGWYLERARSLPPWSDPPPVPGSFRRRAVEDVRYTMASMAGMWRFPHYATHRPYYQLIEYAGWVRRLALERPRSKKPISGAAAHVRAYTTASRRDARTNSHVTPTHACLPVSRYSSRRSLPSPDARRLIRKGPPRRTLPAITTRLTAHSIQNRRCNSKII